MKKKNVEMMPLGWEMMGVSNKTDAFSFLLLVYLGLQG
jgi:hypothetical protein